MIINNQDLKDFLVKYKTPRVIICTTLKKDYVSVISPIRTICGAEVYCSEQNYQEVLNLVRG